MWGSIRLMYGGAVRFARAAPLLFLLPALVEFAQHVAEVQAGMYLSREAARAAADDPTRLAFGFAKTLALTLPGYWFIRFLAYGGALRRTLAFDPRAICLFAIQFAVVATLQFVELFGPSPATMLALHGQAATIATIVLGLIQGIIGIYLTAWFVAWPLGNRAIGPPRSFAVMSGHFWRTTGYVIAGAIPLMALHYAFGLGAIGRASWLVWVMLSLDALVVGWLALTIAGANYLAARDAATDKGVPLCPEPDPVPAAR